MVDVVVVGGGAVVVVLVVVDVVGVAVPLVVIGWTLAKRRDIIV